MAGDESRNPKATLVFFTHLGTGALRSHHDHGEVAADLGPLFHDVESVGVGETSTFLHERHDGVHHVGVLLVWREVHHDVGCGKHFFIGANGETILGGIEVRLALL